MRFENELVLARRAAREAGNILVLREACDVDSLAGRDIKLAADKKAESVILACLQESDYPVLSEESDEKRPFGGGFRWIVDPLDGTFNYYKNLGDLYCTSIALWKDEAPVLGVVYQCGTHTLFEGIVGEGAWVNGLAARPSTVGTLDQSVLATGFSVKGDFSAARLQSYIRLFQQLKKIRMLGAAALMSAYVSCGMIDVYHEKDILLWDVAAGIAITLAAGGLAEYTLNEGYRCDVTCFANSALQTEYKQMFQ